MEFIAGATLTTRPARRNPELRARNFRQSPSGRSSGTPFDDVALGFDETSHVNGSPPPKGSRVGREISTRVNSTAPCSSCRWERTREVTKSIELANPKFRSDIETLGAPFSPPVRSNTFVFRTNDSCDNHLKPASILALARVSTHFLLANFNRIPEGSSVASPLLRTLRATSNKRIRKYPRPVPKGAPSGDQGECAD
jgi:hypothetical protein